MSDNEINTKNLLTSIWDKLEGNVFIGYQSNKEFKQTQYTANKIDEIITFIDNHKQDTQLYFTPYTFNEGSRKSENGKGGRCLFLDIDFGDGHHSNTNQPYPTKQETLDALLSNYEKINLKPSYIVDTGGGFHLYWLVEEDIVSSHTKDEVKNFNESIFQLGLNPGDRGRFVNERKDISSYLRIPNTFNLKNGGRLDVKIIDGNGKRYSFTGNILPSLTLPDTFNIRHTSDTHKIIQEDVDYKLKKYKKGVFYTFLTSNTLTNPINDKTYSSYSEKELGITNFLMYKFHFTPVEILYLFDNYLVKEYTHYVKYINKSDKVDYIDRNIIKCYSERYGYILLSRKYPFIKLHKDDEGYRIDKQILVSWFYENEINKFLDDCITIDFSDRLYNGKLWKVFSEIDLREYIHKSFQDKGIDLLTDCVHELVKQITWKPFKIKTITSNFREKFVISFLNGSLEVYPKEKKYIFHKEEWKKEDYCFYQIQENFEEWLISEDRWTDKQCGMYFRDFYKPECQDVIQMYLSSVLIPDFNLEKVLLIKGKGGSGKSTLSMGITNLFDRDSISHLEISQWGKTHHNLKLVNSLLNISNETSNIKVESHIFRGVVDGTPQPFNPKFSPTFETPVKARHIITINEFPKQIFDGPDKRRYLLLQTIKSVPENQQVSQYKEDFIRDRIYLLNFMLRGINKLIDNNYQINYQDEDLLYQLRIESDYLVRFVEGYLSYVEGEKTKVSDIHQEFELWRQDKSYVTPMSPEKLMIRIYRILNTDEKYEGVFSKPYTSKRVMYLFNVKLNTLSD
jgi:hypothetical protein